MSSPGQKRGTCGHVMAMFDGHLKCPCCRDKGVGDDPCVLKKNCPICKAFTAEEVQQLAIPTSNQEVLSDRDPPKDDELVQEFFEEANYRETMRGVRSFMGWHQIPDFVCSSS